MGEEVYPTLMYCEQCHLVYAIEWPTSDDRCNRVALLSDGTLAHCDGLLVRYDTDLRPWYRK